MTQRKPVWKTKKRLEQKKQRNTNKINKNKEKKYKNTTKNTKENHQILKIKTSDVNKKTKS